MQTTKIHLKEREKFKFKLNFKLKERLTNISNSKLNKKHVAKEYKIIDNCDD